MRHLLIFSILFFPMILTSKEQIDFENYKRKNDSILRIHEEQITKLRAEADDAKEEIVDLKNKYDYLERISEKTFNSISNQLDASSYNLTIFGFLFGIAALGLGLYVTYIERKILTIREENKSLLSESENVKDEVVAINESIKKDIYGLFLKIKRQETIHILNRLLKIPDDIANLQEQLLSRELEKDDFYILKEAYLKLKDQNKNMDEDEDTENNFGFLKALNVKTMRYNSYKTLFFQHFMDLTVKDEYLNEELIDYYKTAVESAFENDIIKSTQDFMNGILEIGYQSKSKEINSFIKAISLSEYKNLNSIFQIMFESLKTSENQFNFFNIITDDKDNRIGKLNFGKLLISSFSMGEKSKAQEEIINLIKELETELQTEEKERKLAEEKIKAEKAERKRKLEEMKAEKDKPK